MNFILSHAALTHDPLPFSHVVIQINIRKAWKLIAQIVTVLRLVACLVQFEMFLGDITLYRAGVEDDFSIVSDEAFDDNCSFLETFFRQEWRIGDYQVEGFAVFWQIIGFMGVIVIVELEAFAVALESFVKLEDFCVV